MLMGTKSNRNYMYDRNRRASTDGYLGVSFCRPIRRVDGTRAIDSWARRSFFAGLLLQGESSPESVKAVVTLTLRAVTNAVQCFRSRPPTMAKSA